MISERKRAYNVQYRLDNLVRLRRYDKARYPEKYRKNKHKYAACARLWRSKNKERAAEISRRWALNNPERLARRIKKYEANMPIEVRERRRKRSREYHRKHKVRLAKYMAAWSRENPELRRASNKRFRQRYPNYHRAFHRRRRLNIKIRTVNLPVIKRFVAIIKSKPFALCKYCGRKVSTKLIHFDHIMPLSRGGLHALENLCVACPKCNCSKGDLTVAEWVKREAKLK